MPDRAHIEQLIRDVGADGTVELFGQFQKDVARRLGQLDALGAAHGEAREMRLHAHSLKGLCLTYGAPDGAAVALALEQACDGGDWNQIAACLEIVARQLPAMADAAEALARELAQ